MRFTHSTQRGRQIASLLVCFFLCFFLFSCGQKHSSSPGPARYLDGGASQTQTQTQTQNQTGQTLDEILQQIDAYPTPAGVDPAKFQALKDQFKKLFVEHTRGKVVSEAPQLSKDKVTDLTAVYNGSTVNADLTWTEKLNGDYDNDGEVNITDVGRLSLFLGYTIYDPDVDPVYHRNYICDGDGVPEIGFWDLYAIYENFTRKIESYKVYRRLTPQSSWGAAIATVNRPSPPTYARPTYTHSDDISGIQAYWSTVQYQVRPYGDGSEGSIDTRSDPVNIYFPGGLHSVSGTVTSGGRGLSGVLMSLYANPPGLKPMATAMTAGNGAYTITNVPNGSYTLVPYKDTYSFSPWDRSVNVSGSNVTGQDFTGSVVTYTVSGHIRNKYDADLGMPNVKVSLKPPVGDWMPTYTDGDGYFSFSVPSGAYIAYASKAGCDFDPDVESAVLVQTSNVTFDVIGWGILDSSPWPKFRSGPLSTGQSMGNGPATEPNTYKWRYGTGGEVSSSPAVGNDGEVYVGSHDTNFYALDPSDGSQDWTYDTGGAIESSPAVAGDGTVYVGSDDYYVYAFNTTGTGDRVRWSYETGGAVKSSPTIDKDGIIYVGSSDGYVYALRPTADPDDNRVKWSHETGGAVVSSPAIGPDGTIYVGSEDDYVYALDHTDGSVKWSFDAGAIVDSSPALSSDGSVLYVATTGYTSGYQYVYALYTSDGSEAWSFPSGAFGSFFSSPAPSFDGGSVYICATGLDTHLYKLDSGDGSETWYYSLPVLGSQSSVALGVDGTVYVGASDGSSQPSLYAVNPDGTLLWDYDIGAGTASSPAIIPNPSDPGDPGTIYIGCADDYVYAFGT